eukprot:gene10652-10811_t
MEAAEEAFSPMKESLANIQKKGNSGLQDFPAESRSNCTSRKCDSEARQRNKYEEKTVDGVVDIPELEEEGKQDITKLVVEEPEIWDYDLVLSQLKAELQAGSCPGEAGKDDVAVETFGWWKSSSRNYYWNGCKAPCTYNPPNWKYPTPRPPKPGARLRKRQPSE